MSDLGAFFIAAAIVLAGLFLAGPIQLLGEAECLHVGVLVRTDGPADRCERLPTKPQIGDEGGKSEHGKGQD